jgi:AraC family transcriptional regulator
MIVPVGEASVWQHIDSAEHLHLRLDPNFISQIAQEMGDINPSKIAITERFSTQDPRIEHIGLALAEELKTGGTTGRLYSDSLTTALAVHLLRYHASAVPRITPPANGLPPSKLRQALDYFQERLSSDISLVELTQTLGISQSHFSTLFRQSMGLSPYQYLLRQRVERAKTLLLQSEASIAEIAIEVGFYDQSHLARHMRRVVGVSPKQIRSSA